ncbi:MAG: site-specific integrase [Methylobacter sp.]|nr:site-specific integrase [Methylobacter sp.]
MAITTFELDALKPKAKPYLIRTKQRDKKDGVLAFKVLPSGDVDAYFIYYVERKEKQIKIGRYGKGKNGMTLKAIHDKYDELSKKYQGGADIKAQKLAQDAQDKREAEEQAALERKIQLQGSFKQLIGSYIDYAQIELSKSYYTAAKGAFALNLKDFDTSIKADQITQDDIRAILRPIRQRGTLVMANRMRSYLSAAFAWAIELESEDTGFCAPISDNVQFFIKANPVLGVGKPLKEESPAVRFLTEPELQAFWQAMETSGMHIHRKNILKLMVCTGARVEALAGLQWSEVHLSQRFIHVPPARSKNGLDWIIPLNDIAFDILSTTPRLHDELVFPANNGIEPLRADGINQATRRLCEQAGIELFTPRDLRRTFKTLSGKAGLSKEIRDKIQNHALTDVSTKHYDLYDYFDEKQEALTRWNGALGRIIDGTYTQLGLKAVADVLPFRKTA